MVNPFVSALTLVISIGVIAIIGGIVIMVEWGNTRQNLIISH